jgi:hypothetical protein
MPQNEPLSQEDQEALDRFMAEFEAEFRKSPELNLEDWAFCFWESVARASFAKNALEESIARIEKVASVVLSEFVDELPEDCSPEQARTWARSDEALADTLAAWPTKDTDETQGAWLLINAVGVLVYAECCRHEIETGSADTAAWAMRQAMDRYDSIYRELDARSLNQAHQWLEGTKIGRQKALEAKTKEHRIWFGEYRKLRAQWPNWSRNRIAKEIAARAKPPRDRSTVLRALKRLDESATSGS